MTSRTTKQAARVYQKAHDVPYAEALHRVMQTEEPTPMDALDGGVGEGKGAASSNEPFVGHRLDRDEPVYIDPWEWVRSVSDPLVLNLGTGALPNTGFHPGSVPVRWVPADDAQEDRAATLGVYGRTGEGKTVYLSNLVRDHLASVPTLVVTAYPESYPQQEGLEFLDRDLVRDARYAEGMAGSQAQETMRAFDERLDASLAAGVEVVVYDDGPENALRHLLRTARSRSIIVLFSSQNVEQDRSDGFFSPGGGLPDASITVMLAPMQAPHGFSWVARYLGSWVRKAGHQSMPMLRPEAAYLPSPESIGKS